MSGPSDGSSGRATAAPTPLQRQLDGSSTRPRATPVDALKTASRWLGQGRRLDVQALAAELGVSRVTLHRWIGTRDQLLVEVLWHLAERSLTRLADEVAREHPPRSHTAEILSRWTDDVLVHPGIRQLQTEGDLLARLLTRDASEFQSRIIALVTDLLTADIEHGRVTIDLPPGELAYATIRIVESFVHTPAITGGAPDSVRNARVLRALLR